NALVVIDEQPRGGERYLLLSHLIELECCPDRIGRAAAELPLVVNLRALRAKIDLRRQLRDNAGWRRVHQVAAVWNVPVPPVPLNFSRIHVLFPFRWFASVPGPRPGVRDPTLLHRSRVVQAQDAQRRSTSSYARCGGAFARRSRASVDLAPRMGPRTIRCAGRAAAATNSTRRTQDGPDHDDCRGAQLD